MIQQLPFYKIFDTLRKNGFPLGISEYKALIEVLSGYKQYQPTEAIIGKSELYEICKTLWLKPNQVPIMFETIFYEQYDQIFRTAQQTTTALDAEKSTKSNSRNKAQEKQEQGNQLPQEKDEALPYFQEKLPDVSDHSSGHPLGVRIVLGVKKGTYQHVKEKGVIEPNQRFLFSDNYFPVTLRELQQLFKYLPEKKQQQAEDKIDIDATINSIALNGYLMKAEYVKKQEIFNNLLILHDHNGSMVAFEKLSEMITSARRTLFENLKDHNSVDGVYYFQNAIEKYIYKNKANTIFTEMNDFVNLFGTKKVMLIIVSDAGAARGSNSNIRVRLSVRMLMDLQKITNRIVWLNPLPQDRWEKTSAERIAEFVPMFTIDRKGIQRAAETLRGKQAKIY